MSFIDAYILLSIAGFFSHKIYQTIRKKGHKSFIAYYSFFIILGFLILDLFIYLGFFDILINTIYNNRFIDGKDYMWSPFSLFSLDIDINIQGSGQNWLAFLLFASYPCWFLYWKNISKYLFGVRYYSGGWLDVLKPIKKPKNKQSK